MKSSRNVDNQSDIWALGVVLYELLQGAPPWAAEAFGSMAIKVAELAHVLALYAQSTAQAAVSVEHTSRVLGPEPPRSPSTLRRRNELIVRVTQAIQSARCPETGWQWLNHAHGVFCTGTGL